ncbi:MAG: hypothetical protein KBD52_00170 [Candidatus Pacebacteria bacterium]|nr:hypothetical protein [Candidatus Paceibacterota bacterium]
MPFIISSNIFLLVPFFVSLLKGEWLYFAFAVGLLISSIGYHYIKLYKPSSVFFKFFKTLDWVVAVSAYAYMFYFIFTKVENIFQLPLILLLLVTIVFFWYGYKFSNYHKFHPWFHVVAFTASGLVVFMGA